jgi:hypothetical protein
MPPVDEAPHILPWCFICECLTQIKTLKLAADVLVLATAPDVPNLLAAPSTNIDPKIASR